MTQAANARGCTIATEPIAALQRQRICSGHELTEAKIRFEINFLMQFVILTLSRTLFSMQSSRHSAA
jgi:hypothetical protein